MKRFLFLLMLSPFFSCQYGGDEEIKTVLKQWSNRQIVLPEMNAMDTIGNYVPGDYNIVSYLDSKDCFSCKLNYREWMKLKQLLPRTEVGQHESHIKKES